MYKYISLVLFLAVSCTQSNPNNLRLNDGQKWMVNEEMKPFIENSEQIFEDYRNQGGTDYKVLAMEMKELNDSLIANCTMEGESHEELHKWLFPHIKIIGQLSKTDNTDEAGQLIDELEESFETFELYFE